MKQNSIKQYDQFLSIAFNKDYSIVIAGQDKDIRGFKHIQGKLNQIQLLSEHTGNVFTLNLMKNPNNYVSGSDDNSSIIWYRQVIIVGKFNKQ
ncbi:unnamed protein product [Paramecium sonneborni]|uniref:Uncharacterized protein n=1 Tax=Paramecium sonneborni TaxID=65129 RepID=A0A8S1RQU9_9CILI|nr:unnamed protein product [Paramecium sonneborni]